MKSQWLADAISSGKGIAPKQSLPSAGHRGLPQETEVTETHGLRFDQTRFWVIHRRTEYGPFDYDWSIDLSGLELIYQGVKFGEICSPEELYADLREFQLPVRVVYVASLVMGCTALGLSRGYNEAEKLQLLRQTLRDFDCERFLPDQESGFESS